MICQVGRNVIDMWESPVNIFEIHEPIIEEINKQTEETVFKAIHRVGIDVNREELIKAMQYDRNQYEKGYKDAIDEFVEKMEAWNENIKSIRNEDAFFTIEAIREIEKQMKGGVK
jgi:uncharacterized membrane-anchored protein